MQQRLRHLYEFGEFTLDATERVLLRREQAVPLTPKVFDTLLVLVENGGHLLSKDDLLRAVWPDSIVEEGSINRNISTLRRALGEAADEARYIETVPKLGYRFVAAVNECQASDAVPVALRITKANVVFVNETAGGGQDAVSGRPPVAAALTDSARPTEAAASDRRLESVGGAVPLDSEFYIVRPADEEFRLAVARQESVVLVKGARQTGKTSLLARGLHQARQSGARVVLADLQSLNADQLASAGAFFFGLAGMLADGLGLDVPPERVWSAHRGASINFERYVLGEALGKLAEPIVWGLDEADRLFTCPFASEVFGLFRSWHNRRALDPEGPWQRLTLAVAYATEAHLFITDLNQSPFNVGVRVTLEDFTLPQVAELNRRYGSPLRDEAEVGRYFRLVGGNPYLVRRGLYEMVVHGLALDELEARAGDDEGPFGDHLRRLLVSLSRDAALCQALGGVLGGQPCASAESFYRLRSAGVVLGDSAQRARPRSELYATYLRSHLQSHSPSHP
jgi:DNA-binding winged helix-turn-helix (wHTH) protein